MRKVDFILASSALRLLKGGSVEVRTGHTKSLAVSINGDTIDLDFLDPSPFRSDARKRIGILDSLQHMKGLGKALSNREITLSISRKSKPVLKIGKKATPTFSRVASWSKEIQIVNLNELRKLDRELIK